VLLKVQFRGDGLTQSQKQHGYQICTFINIFDYSFSLSLSFSPPPHSLIHTRFLSIYLSLSNADTLLYFSHTCSLTLSIAHTHTHTKSFSITLDFSFPHPYLILFSSPSFFWPLEFPAKNFQYILKTYIKDFQEKCVVMNRDVYN
jgi:hypothetical protein